MTGETTMQSIKKMLRLLFIIPLCLYQFTLFPEHTTTQHTGARDVTLEDIFLRAHLYSADEIDTLNKRCQELNLALSFEQDENNHELNASIAVRGLQIPIPQKLLEHIYVLLSKENTYNNKKAYVRVCDSATSMGYDEKKVIAQRLIVCQKNIETLIGKKITPTQTPRIALCGSGGGVRAALSTAGFLYGLEQEQLMDCLLYAAGLSGSTWALAPWMYSPDNFCTFYPKFTQRITHGFLHTSPSAGLKDLKQSLPTIAHYFLKKLIFKEIPSVIDMYGYCLSLTLFDETLKDNYLSVDLADQKTFIENGQRPFPLYAAVIPHNDKDANYSWLTFSPYEVVNTDFYTAVPTWSFGRKFSKGASTTFAPPLTGGFLLGLWGSALSVSCEEIYRMLIDKLEPKAIFAPLKQLVESTTIGETRLFPAQLRNTTYELEQFPYATEKRTTVVDAGLNFNVPLPPLLTSDRKIDIIIICDSSADVIGAPELKLAETWAHNNHIPFPKIYYNGISDRPYTIFDDGEKSHTPIIVYVPMVYNKKYSSIFDPQESLGMGQFLNTLNFSYSEQQAFLLSGLFIQAAHELKADLVKTIQTVVDRKA
jgi:hypothetical protein